jgi:hypothetical protein
MAPPLTAGPGLLIPDGPVMGSGQTTMPARSMSSGGQ